MTRSDTGPSADEVAAAQAAARNTREVPMTDRVADLLDERRQHAERDAVARDERLERRVEGLRDRRRRGSTRGRSLT